MSAAGRDLVFIGDVHLDRGESAVDDFARFIDRLVATSDRIVLMGDLFNLWIGRREIEQPHQRVVLDALARARRSGVKVRYLEGNRDYRIGDAYGGRELDDAGEAGIVEQQGPLRLFAVHGDLVNERDRQYRAWRRLSRSGPVWWLFNVLPRARRVAYAEGLEARLRSTNLDMKRDLPEAAIRATAARQFAAGIDIVVLGHFHIERELAAAPPSPPGRILILPEWKGSRRHLRVTPDGDARFVDS